MRKEMPSVSVITVNYNGKQLLRDCFDSLLVLNYPKNKLEIIMVDNGSDDDSIDYVKKRYPRTKVIKNDINNYCKANNLGISESRGEYVAILNNDTKVHKNWLAELIKVISKDDKIGAVGSKILFLDGRIQSTGHIEFPNYNWGDRGLLEEDREQYDHVMEMQSVSNCSALYRRKALDSVGLFDEDFNMYMEDVDLAFRLRRKGWKIFFVPNSVTYHKLHGSQQAEELRQFHILKNRLLFIAKHFPDELAEDIYGFGEITKVAYADLQKILILIFNKLIANQKFNNVVKIMSKLEKSIAMLDEYRQHCLRVELENRTADFQQQLREKDNQMNNLLAELKIRDGQLREKDNQMNNLLAELKIRDGQLREKDNQMNNLLAELKIRDEQIHIKNIEIAEKTEEVSKIYNSETYRLIVRPIIWPCLSFMKKIRRIILVPLNAVFFIFSNLGIKNNDIDICVASFYAKNAIAKYMQDNEYFIKIVNNKYREDKFHLVIDIWPYNNSYHPQRHFANFSIELIIEPRNFKLIKLIYNWEQKAVFFINNNEVRLHDFWRGDMESFELYLISIYIRSLEGKILYDRLNILQRLEQ
jgi:GT2 family glycosyltransferase